MQDNTGSSTNTGNQIYANEKDFKYVIQDFSSTQIGSRFTFEEMMMHDRVPFKFQSIIKFYLLKEADPQDEIGHSILNISEDDYSYHVYKQLRIKIAFCQPKKGGGYKLITKKFLDFKDYQKNEWTDEHVLQHIIVSNLALMAFTV